jgi:Tfp pilus assembly protein PilN
MSLNIIPEDQIKVSLHTLGNITSNNLLPFEVDFLAATRKNAVDSTIEIPLGDGKYFRLTPPIATIISLAILIPVLVIFGTGILITNSMKTKAENKNSELETKITEIDNQLKNYNANKDNSQFDPIQEIERVLKNNRTKIMAYAALGESIPKNLYLTYFMTGNDGYIDVKGCADSVEDVYIFFQNLKDSLVGSNLRLSKLDLKANSLDNVVNSTMSTIDDASYIFEITNMSNEQLQSFMDKLSGKESKETNNAAQPANPKPQTPAPASNSNEESEEEE